MENIIHLPIQFFAEDGDTAESAPVQETAPEEDNWENAFADESVDTQTEPAAEESEAEPTEQQPEEQPEQMVQITHLGEVKEVPLSEAITLAQKGMDYDHVRQERDELKNAPENALMDYFAQKGGMTRAEYIESLRQQMEQDQLSAYTQKGMDEEMARTMIELKEFKERQQKEEEEKKQEEAQKEQYRQFFREFPGVSADDIPDDVWQRVTGGETLVAAYRAHENAQLKAKLAALEQNNKNRETAVGSLTGEVGAEAPDPFLDGFLNA